MYSHQIKRWVFVLEGLNSLGLTYYFYYFYFFTHQKFGFDNQANLVLAAVNGLVCMVAAIYGGRYAQRAGYFRALKVGFGIMLGALSVGWWCSDQLAVQIAVFFVTTVGMCFTWPTFEAMVSEGETYAGLQRNLGFYNVVWAATAAAAYFSGGAILEWLGNRSLFYLPVAVLGTQLALTFRMQKQTARDDRVAKAVGAPGAGHAAPAHPQPPATAKAFLRMAWLANPFSYIAVNTLVAVMPAVSQRLRLSTTLAGVCCSLWCFSRLGAFCGLWFWPGWHYRFRWLLTAYLALVVTFAVMLLVPNLAIVIAAEIVLGGTLGLIYYSSLFYSMDVGDTKGEHGGIHEAAIGLGNFLGPAVGALALRLAPNQPLASAWAVSSLLALGLGGLIWLRCRAPR